jgi:pimeloyl-ACP methyl ester carboxylesterase
MFEPATARALRIPVNPADPNSPTLAVEITEGQGPTFVWFAGSGSNMNATKSVFMKEQCEAWGYRLIRFDRRGIGLSPADIHTLGMTEWLADACAIIDQLTDSPCIFIGSSFGAWLALLTARVRPNRCAGFIGISSALDYTAGRKQLQLSDEQAKHLEQHSWADVGDSIPLTKKFIDDANDHHLMLNNKIEFNEKPVALLYGMQDDVIENDVHTRLINQLTSPDITAHIIKDGNHSLSRPQDLDLLWQVVTNMREKVIQHQAQA